MAIGIDLGTTNSLIAVWQDGEATLIPNVHGDTLTPSVVGLDGDGKVLIGAAAKERLLTHPHLTQAHFKRDMGTKKTVTLGKKAYRPEELSALLLRQLKADAEAFLGREIDEVVISVPAYFNNVQRQATKLAGQLAGLRVERIINEPTAASLAYDLHEKNKESTFLVFDLGGGTFDVSIIELFDGIIEIRASTGNNHLGGEDFTQRLLKSLAHKSNLSDQLIGKKTDDNLRPLLRKKAEDAKKLLSKQSVANVTFAYQSNNYQCQISEAEFKDISEDLLQELRIPIERALRDANLNTNDLDAIILVGGATRMTMIKRFVATLFGQLPLTHLNPDEVVARGAAVQAGLKDRDKALSDVVVTDVCPYTLGTAMVDWQQESSKELYYQPIIERNTVIPTSRVITGCNTFDNQAKVEVRVYQGEHYKPDENIELGKLRFSIPRGPAGTVAFDIRYTYDINGLLEVEVTCNKTQQVERLVIDNGNNRMSNADIEKCLAKLAKLKVHPRDEEKNRLLLARSERLYSELTGDVRDHIRHIISFFNSILNKQDPIEIARAQEELTKQLQQIEYEHGLI